MKERTTYKEYREQGKGMITAIAMSVFGAIRAAFPLRHQ
jgi:hypothetical protein